MKDGMVHISEIASYRINRVEDLFDMGDDVVVRCKEVDDRGRASLTIKGVTSEEWAENYPGVELHPSDREYVPSGPPPERSGGDRGGRGGGYGGGRGGDRGGRGGGGYRR